jgi:hypothetical protein
MKDKARAYEAEFGVVPEFRIGIHGGSVVASVRLSISATPSTPPQDCRACARTSPATFLYREACWIGCNSRVTCGWRNWETSRYGARLSGWMCAPCSDDRPRSKAAPRIR